MEDITNSNEVIVDGDTLVFQCPTCQSYVIVCIKDINCKIFRHGVDLNYVQINPHLPKSECLKLAKSNLIYGCGNPFKINYDLKINKYHVTKCDYI